jgi:NAD(P)-dependent dehydrogenase (short-subunit alcohol dehydrogenase family)
MGLKNRKYMKTILITGSSRGLGLGLTKVALQKNYNVIATCRPIEDNHALKELEKLNENLHVVFIDVTSDENLLFAKKEIEKITSKIDVIINCAGANSRTASPEAPDKAKKLGSLDRQILLKMFNLNAISPLMVVQNFTDLLQKSDAPLVVNISSNRASYSDFNTAANYGYSGSKAALNMITKDLTFDLAPLNIHVFSVHPGEVLTDMNPNGDLKPEEAAEKIISLIGNFKPEMNGRFLDNSGDFYPL